MNCCLSKEYVSVGGEAGKSYGGSQMRAESASLRKVGCGVVAGLDLLIYLYRSTPDLDGGLFRGAVPPDGPIAPEQYNALLRSLSRGYLPLIPGHGINGLMLALGLNRFFLKHHMPFLASWGVPYSLLWQRIEDMLRDDIPVILSIGPNLPLFWQKHGLGLYTKSADGSYRCGPVTHAHYVTVTGMDDEWLQISSWGRKYHIRRDEYLAFVRRHSLKLVNNILLVKRKGGRVR